MLSSLSFISFPLMEFCNSNHSDGGVCRLGKYLVQRRRVEVVYHWNIKCFVANTCGCVSHFSVKLNDSAAPARYTRPPGRRS